MENFKVRTYNPAKRNRFSDSQTPKELRKQNKKIGEQTPKNALFILSRGQNAGKSTKEIREYLK